MLMDYEKALEEAVGGCMIGVEWGGETKCGSSKVLERMIWGFKAARVAMARIYLTCKTIGVCSTGTH